MNTEYNDVCDFQDPATPIAEAITDLHNYIFFYLIIVLFLVLVVMLEIFYESLDNYTLFLDSIIETVEGKFVKPDNFYNWRMGMLKLNKVNHATNLEIIWTVFPSFILILIAIPSLSLLYSMDEMLYPELTFKAIGYQWYWSYEISGCVSEERLFELNILNYENVDDVFPISFDSYMQSTDWVNFGHRLLAVDQILALPVRRHLRVLVTGADVLHSWAVPAFGIKIDAVPGRLNQGAIFIKRTGVFYGQCSELCGVNHGFMPIVVHVMDNKFVESWALGLLKN